MALYVLFESASGYSLFHAYGLDEIGQNTEAVQTSILDLERFGRVVKLAAFNPFSSDLDPINQCNAFSEGLMTDEQRNFMEINFPKVKDGKKVKVSLGLADPQFGSHISETTKTPCQNNEFVLELLRGVPLYFDRWFIEDLTPSDLEEVQLGLGDSFNRAKVKFNVNEGDNMVIQVISLLDTLDKNINMFSIRVGIPRLADMLDDEDKAKKILEGAKPSMGQDLSPFDFFQQVVRLVMDLADYRKNLFEYLVTKMRVIAPNLASLIGEVAAARLISHAGSLENLAKCSSSTIQTLGAKKLNRDLKTNPSISGLIFRLPFIDQASAQNKGRIARYLANKCSIASRFDYFSAVNSTVLGEKLHKQVDERLQFFMDTRARGRGDDEKIEKASLKKHKKKKNRKLVQDGDTPMDGDLKKKEESES